MKINFKERITAFSICCFLATSLFSQTLTQDDLVKTADELIEADLNGNGNEAYVNQIGRKNTVSIVQDQQGTSSENLVKVLQVGKRNLTAVKQAGMLNQTVVLQKGNKNEYTLNLEGSENTFVIKQEGRRNVINQNLTNTSNTYIELIQQGNDNEITHTQDGLTEQNIIVRQVGDNMSVQVIQSNNN
ncbi:MAG: hypothetical protein AB8H03_21645 [Saprospiraceae bacterium]